jgi:peptide/nickel transport system permease protein
MSDKLETPEELNSEQETPTEKGSRGEARTPEERYYFASQWQLMWRKFKKHRLAILGTVVLAILYFIAIFCEFLAPYNPYKRYADYSNLPPQRVRFFHEGQFRGPFVYGLTSVFDEDKFVNVYTQDPSKVYPLRLFVRGDEYKFWGLWRTDLHLFGAVGGQAFLFGTDELGRDLLSKTFYAARVSLSIGLVGVALSFVLGCALGGVSGYFGGATDTVIQRIIEFLISLPTIPLWMALAAALPPDWPSIKLYFGITIILSIVGWCGIARVVRGKLLEVREEDFVMAAQINGLSQGRIISRHLLPSFLSYLIVNLTLAVPNMILAETALSFLGLGIRPPALSFGVLLQNAQNVRTVNMHPWLMIPGLFVIVTVLAFNFLGDGLRDAADPYK